MTFLFTFEVGNLVRKRNNYSKRSMPAISMFYGLIVYMYYLDNKQHHFPHIHVRYQEDEGVYKIPDGVLIEGSLPSGKSKLVVAWIELHKDELMANWQLAANGEKVFNIDPLK